MSAETNREDYQDSSLPYCMPLLQIMIYTHTCAVIIDNCWLRFDTSNQQQEWYLAHKNLQHLSQWFCFWTTRKNKIKRV